MLCKCLLLLCHSQKVVCLSPPCCFVLCSLSWLERSWLSNIKNNQTNLSASKLSGIWKSCRLWKDEFSAEAGCRDAAGQGHVNSLDLGDVRGLLDDSAGQRGPHGAALPQSTGRSGHTHPGDGERLSGASLARVGNGLGPAALLRRAALPLGQVGQSDSSVDLPPALVDPSALPRLPVDTSQKQPVTSRSDTEVRVLGRCFEL